MEIKPDELTWLLAAAGGVMSFLSPCVLPLVPGYLSYVSGHSVESLRQDEGSLRRTGRIVWQTLLFIAGFTAVFMLLGGVAGGLGELFFDYRRALEIAGGLLVIFFGIFLAGVYRPEFMEREFRPSADTSASGTGSLLLGASFGFGWTPCVGPILGAVLALAGTGGDASRGAFLLLVYSLGLGVPFLLTALLFDRALSWLDSVKRWLVWLERGGGIVLIGMGALIALGQFSRITLWFSRTFPALLEFG